MIGWFCMLLNSQDRLLALGQLFEQWLAAGEDWMQTQIVLESQRINKEKKKAKTHMVSFKHLKEKYGPAKAKEIRQRKYLQEKARDPNVDPDPWHMDHPELGSEDKVGSGTRFMQHVTPTYLYR